MFAPVLLEVPGQMNRCPCWFGAYVLVSRWLCWISRHTVSFTSSRLSAIWPCG